MRHRFTLPQTKSITPSITPTARSPPIRVSALLLSLWNSQARPADAPPIVRAVDA